MVFLGPAKDITRLLEDNKKEVAEAVKSASTSYDKFISLLNIDKLNEEYIQENAGAEEKSQRMAYFIEMMDAYIMGGPDKKERYDSMQVFADNMQRPFSEVEEVLNYLGLDI